MLAGLDALELGRLRLSVGYGTHKKGRPYSPVEVGLRIGRARATGDSVEVCARELRLDESGIGRFLSLQGLPEDVRHLIDWGSGKGVVSFSCATEIVRIKDCEDQRTVANAVLAHGMTSKEVRQVAQLLRRSAQSAEDAVEEVVGMRPTVVKRYVYLGTVRGDPLVRFLDGRTQRERDALLASTIAALKLKAVSGRLGSRQFALVGDARLGQVLAEMQADELEERLCAVLEQETSDVDSHG
ncbi:MAG: hypothetical protein OXH75_25650 [Acidobacteria bacterium]|nr:hypothetical protein [Acidobacteriota bacterium]